MNWFGNAYSLSKLNHRNAVIKETTDIKATFKSRKLNDPAMVKKEKSKTAVHKT